MHLIVSCSLNKNSKSKILANYASTLYNQEIDDYLYEEVGYDVLNDLVNGLFVSAYAATSINEYYARGFEEWVFGHRAEIKKLCPALYRIFDDLFEEAK